LSEHTGRHNQSNTNPERLAKQRAHTRITALECDQRTSVQH
jgi:hypothetical protein